MQISKDKIGYIVSNAFLFSDKAQKLRNEIITDNRLSTVVNFERYMIFEDASITSCVILFEKDKNKTKVFLLKDKNYEITDIANFIDDDKNAFEVNFEMNNVFALVGDKIAKINQKIDGSHRQLQDIVLIEKGMETACNSVFSFDYFPKQFPKEFIRKQMIGENINPYRLNSSENYLLYFENVDNFDDLPKSIQEHLISNQDILKNRATVKNEGRVWYRYARPMHKDCYHLNKIWCSYRSSKNAFVLDESSDYIGLTNTTVIFDTNADIDLKYLLSILNSKLFSFVISPLESKRVVAFLNFLQVGLVNFPFQKYQKTSNNPLLKKQNKCSV